MLCNVLVDWYTRVETYQKRLRNAILIFDHPPYSKECPVHPLGPGICIAESVHNLAHLRTTRFTRSRELIGRNRIEIARDNKTPAKDTWYTSYKAKPDERPIRYRHKRAGEQPTYANVPAPNLSIWYHKRSRSCKSDSPLRGTAASNWSPRGLEPRARSSM